MDNPGFSFNRFSRHPAKLFLKNFVRKKLQKNRSGISPVFFNRIREKFFEIFSLKKNALEKCT